ncbi:entericidin A/B family lipoprotein [Palleronia sp. LCG004]|nr:entericidin A/B family lipoprotein [Palleronia sp. LCG004]WOI56961.1 entericidin A/B family lipoprotein [Palleronia sp. LCG004]
MSSTTKFLALFGLLALAACETVGGAGQDIQSAGRAVQGTAQDVQNDL